MLIGTLAEATGTTPSTLRFYEREGLLAKPDRRPNGYRDYDPGAADRVTFIQQAQTAGLTLSQIGEILAIHDRGEPPCSHVEELVDQRLEQVTRRITALQETRRTLEALSRRSRHLDPADCDDFCHIIRTGTSDA